MTSDPTREALLLALSRFKDQADNTIVNVLAGDLRALAQAALRTPGPKPRTRDVDPDGLRQDDGVYPSPIPSPQGQAAEEAPAPAGTTEPLSKLDRAAIERQIDRLNDMAEGWLEEARDYSADPEGKAGERAMMRVAGAFTPSINALIGILSQPSAPTAADTGSGAGWLAQARPDAWVIPGDDTARDCWLDARIDRNGEFSKPLYSATTIMAALSAVRPKAP